MVDVQKLIAKTVTPSGLSLENEPSQNGGVRKRRPWLEGTSETVQRQLDSSDHLLKQQVIESSETDQRQFEDNQRQFEDNQRQFEDNQRQFEDTSRTDQGQIRDSSKTVRGLLQRQVQRQFEDSSETVIVASILTPSALAGTRRKVVYYLFQKAHINRTRSTGIITVVEACKALTISGFNWKKTTQRLARDGWFLAQGFNGAGGSTYTFSEEVWLRLLEDENIGIFATLSSKIRDSSETGSETGSETKIPLSSSSSLNLNTKTTTTQDFGSGAFGLSGVWREIDQTPLTDQGCPFGPSQIRQAKSFGMSPEALQESIYNFGWALMQNWQPPGGFKSSPLNFFMGCLRSNGLYEHENYYRQKRERAEIEKRWLEECRRKEQEPIMPDADTFIAAAQSGLDLTEFKS